MPRLVRALSLSVGCLLLAFVATLPAADPAASEKWEKDIAAFEAADKANPPPQEAILFIGASSIRLWKTLADDFPEYRVINRGFGGSHLSDSVHFADRIVFPYKPRAIILNAGGNDLNSGKSPEQVLASFQEFVAKVQKEQPGTPIIFLAINASPARWAQAEKQQQANRLIRDFIADKKGVSMVELWDDLLGPDGQPRADLYVADRLHPNEAGYKIRQDLIKKHLASLKIAGDK